MKITQYTIKIEELVKDFKDRDDEGVVGYGGKLNIRPPYQRELIYDEKEQKDVINSIFKNFPLNVMYWVKNADDKFELLDGQQRTLSICYYHQGDFSIVVDGSRRGYKNLTNEQRDKFLNYELQIYICEDATEQERLDWFRIINLAGERLTQQELRNAVYPGMWLTDAKRWFSSINCAAYQIGKNYVDGRYRRQEYLEKVLKWIKSENESIEEYMRKRQNELDADMEWQYFCGVIEWIKRLFPHSKREIMKNVEWGKLYNHYKNDEFNADELEDEVTKLLASGELENKKGVYEYVISRDERVLNFRAFPDEIKWAAYERQNGICTHCGKKFEFKEMEGDHITPWSRGGRTTDDNCQMLCRECNRRKSNK